MLAEVAVNEPKDCLIVVAARDQSLVNETEVDLKRHDRDARLRIKTGSHPDRQALFASGPLLVNHLVTVNIESVGTGSFAVRPEFRIPAPRRERSTNPVMSGHPLKLR